jgi:hypothetical protein
MLVVFICNLNKSLAVINDEGSVLRDGTSGMKWRQRDYYIFVRDIRNKSEVLSFDSPVIAVCVCVCVCVCVLVDGTIAKIALFIVCSRTIRQFFSALPAALSCHGACALFRHLSR